MVTVDLSMLSKQSVSLARMLISTGIFSSVVASSLTATGAAFTVTVIVQAAVFPAESVMVQTTSVVPTG